MDRLDPVHNTDSPGGGPQKPTTAALLILITLAASVDSATLEYQKCISKERQLSTLAMNVKKQGAHG